MTDSDTSRARVFGGTALHRIRHSLASLVGQYPSVYLPPARLKHKWDTFVTARRTGRRNPDAHPPPVGPTTDIVIEGFPRSANSFAVAAFRLAQPRFMHIAHHRHVAAQVLGGISLNIPTLVLIRDPEEAILSLVIRHPDLSLKRALTDYIRFYGPIAPHREGIVCATFEEVTTDFGAVIRRVNDACRASFEVFEHSAANVEECFRQIEQHHRKQVGESVSIEATIPRPSPERRRIKDSLRERFRAEGLKEKRTAAYDLYRDLTEKRIPVAPEGAHH
jgi:hypothetical protein